MVMRYFALPALVLVWVALVSCGQPSECDRASDCAGPTLSPSTLTAFARITPSITPQPTDTARPLPTWTQTPLPSTEAPTFTATPPPADTPVPDVGRAGISGIVLVGPQCPVVREGEECPDKPYEADIDVYDASGAFVTRVRSDADGEFFVAVAAGDYRLEPRSPGAFPFAAPLDVRVIHGITTRVVVQYDSGIR